MKLKTAHVRMFRNFLDSTEIKIDEKVTCLVGKNESGKSAFLNALWRLKPARTKPSFSIPEQYPAWLEKRHRLEGIDQDSITPITVGLEWEPADVKVVEEQFGPGVVKAGTLFELSKQYDNDYRWKNGCDEKQAIRNFLDKQGLPTAEANAYAAIGDFEGLKGRIAEDIKKSAETPQVLGPVYKVAWRRHLRMVAIWSTSRKDWASLS